jgi:hypothetical protein
MSKKMLGRKAKLFVKNRVINFPDLEMEFKINFDTNSDGNTGNIVVYNLSDKTIKVLKKGNVYKFKAGYKDDVGVISLGYVENSTTKFENGAKKTKIVLNEDTTKWANTYISVCWAKNTKGSVIAKDIIDRIPLELGELEVGKEKNYPKGKVFSTDAKKALEELAKDTKSKLHLWRGKVYFRPKNKRGRKVIRLNKDIGLIASPQRIDQADEERWKVQSLLDYRVGPDVVYKIKSKTINGLYRVEKGTHSGKFITETEVVPVED